MPDLVFNLLIGLFTGFAFGLFMGFAFGLFTGFAFGLFVLFPEQVFQIFSKIAEEIRRSFKETVEDRGFVFRSRNLGRRHRLHRIHLKCDGTFKAHDIGGCRQIFSNQRIQAIPARALDDRIFLMFLMGIATNLRMFNAVIGRFMLIVVKFERHGSKRSLGSHHCLIG